MDPVKLPPARPLTLINSKVDGGRAVRNIPLLKGKNTMKTIIFYARKGTRKAKQQGLATAPGSAVTIRILSQMALRGDGRLYIVDAPTAEHGRRLIQTHWNGSRPDIGASPTATVLAGGRIVALGLGAIQALAGASEAIRHWDVRLARDGSVRIRDTTALGKRSDGITPSLVDYFGDGLAKTPP